MDGGDALIEGDPESREARPFGPNVPQPADYLRVWARIRSATSGRANQQQRSVDRFCHDANPKFDDHTPAEPQRDLHHIAHTLAEALREEDREFLRRATDCVLCSDVSSSKTKKT